MLEIHTRILTHHRAIIEQDGFVSYLIIINLQSTRQSSMYHENSVFLGHLLIFLADFDEKGVKLLRATFCFIWDGALRNLKQGIEIHGSTAPRKKSQKAEKNRKIIQS